MAKPVYVDRGLICSKAFLALRGAAPQVLLIFLSKRQVVKIKHPRRETVYSVANNGEIIFTYGEAARKFGISEKRFHNALAQLVRVGFIDIEVYGIGKYRLLSKYALSDRWRLFGMDDFQEKQMKRRSLKIERNRSPRGCFSTGKNAV